MTATYEVLVPKFETRSSPRTVERAVQVPVEESYEVTVDGKTETRVRTVIKEETIAEQRVETYTVTLLLPEIRTVAIPSDTIVLEVTEAGDLRAVDTEFLQAAIGRPCISVRTQEDAVQAHQALVELFGGPDQRLYLITGEAFPGSSSTPQPPLLDPSASALPEPSVAPVGATAPFVVSAAAPAPPAEPM